MSESNGELMLGQLAVLVAIGLLVGCSDSGRPVDDSLIYVYCNIGQECVTEWAYGSPVGCVNYIKYRRQGSDCTAEEADVASKLMRCKIEHWKKHCLVETSLRDILKNCDVTLGEAGSTLYCF